MAKAYHGRRSRCGPGMGWRAWSWDSLWSSGTRPVASDGQTAKGDTKADAKAERAEMVARLYRGERVERSSSRTVGEVAQAWLQRGRGQKGPWDAPTRERYERIVRQQVLAAADP